MYSNDDNSPQRGGEGIVGMNINHLATDIGKKTEACVNVQEMQSKTIK